MKDIKTAEEYKKLVFEFLKKYMKETENEILINLYTETIEGKNNSCSKKCASKLREKNKLLNDL